VLDTTQDLAQQLMQAGEGELHLRLNTSRTHHTAARRVLDDVLQQRGLANTRVATQQGVYGARAWTAPRLELMAQALQEQWAPKAAAALAAYARRVDPVPPKPPRRRWPAVVGGAVLIAGGAAVAVVILNRRNSAPATEGAEPGQAAGPADAPQETPAADPVGADVNGQGQGT